MVAGPLSPSSFRFTSVHDSSLLTFKPSEHFYIIMVHKTVFETAKKTQVSNENDKTVIGNKQNHKWDNLRHKDKEWEVIYTE